MRIPGTALAVASLVGFVTVGCGSSEIDRPSTEETTLSDGYAIPAPEEMQAEADQTMSGRLTKVDAAAETLTLSAEGVEQLFNYTDLTEVVGAAGPQALAGQEGADVTVTYRRQDGSRIVERIELR